MPSPKSAEAPSIVTPTKPTAPQAADDANPGEVEQVKVFQRETGTGKYGSQQVTGHKDDGDSQDKTHWIEITLIDDADQPVGGEMVEIKCPDGSVAAGCTDEKGTFRVESLDPGSCDIKFPNLDSEAWEPA